MICGHLCYKFVHTCQCFPVRQKILQLISEPPLNWSFCESLLELESSQVICSCRKSHTPLTLDISVSIHSKHGWSWNSGIAQAGKSKLSPGMCSLRGERPIYFIDPITHFTFLPSHIHTLKILNRHKHISGTFTGNLRMINYSTHQISCTKTTHYFRPQGNWPGLEKHYWWAPRDDQHCKTAKQSRSFWH